MENLKSNLDPQLNLLLFSLLHPQQDRSMHTKEDHLTRLRLLAQTARYSEMRDNKIPAELFEAVEEKDQKRFDSLKKKYTKILKVVESRKLSSINKKFVSSNKHTKDLHFSQENFVLLSRIARGHYNRGQFEESLRILTLLGVAFEEELPSKMDFYWAKVFSYMALVLERGSLKLGTQLNGAKRRFRKDWSAISKLIEEKGKELSAFNLALQKEVNELKMKFFYAKIVLEYVIRKEHLLARHKPAELEETPRKSSHKKSRKKSTRKMTHQTNDEQPEVNEEADRKDSELADLPEQEAKLGKCLNFMLQKLGLVNFDWSKSETRNTLGYLFVLEVNIDEMLKLKDLSNSRLVRGFNEMWFYAKAHKGAQNQMAFFSFMEALFLRFDFEEATKFLKEVNKEIDGNWIFVNYKGEIYNRILKILVMVFEKVTGSKDKAFLAELLGIESSGLEDVMGQKPTQTAELKEAKQSTRERLNQYLLATRELKASLSN